MNYSTTIHDMQVKISSILIGYNVEVNVHTGKHDLAQMLYNIRPTLLYHKVHPGQLNVTIQFFINSQGVMS